MGTGRDLGRQLGAALRQGTIPPDNGRALANRFGDWLGADRSLADGGGPECDRALGTARFDCHRHRLVTSGDASHQVPAHITPARGIAAVNGQHALHSVHSLGLEAAVGERVDFVVAL
jgi:hypothetical protein